MMRNRDFWILWAQQVFILVWLIGLTFVIGRLQETVDVMNHNIGIVTEQSSLEPIGPRIQEDSARTIEL